MLYRGHSCPEYDVLIMAAKPFPGQLLKIGSTGQTVRDVQARLGIQQTGAYGTTTEAAVKKFQASHQIQVNGQVGPTTWAALFEEAPATLLLPVKYFTQRDSEVVARGQNQAGRSCFSSCNAMIVEYLKPGTLPGTNGDDTYLRKVLSVGDSPDPAAQTLAMQKFYGIPYVHRTDVTFQMVKDHLWKKRIPVNIGILHHGPIGGQLYGGHRILAIGYTPTGLIVHDPYGELDLVNGVYIGDQGKQLTYSYQNLGPRFVGDSGREGWAGFAERP